ncbi:MAG: ABC transporter substrate-binding protein [bacterium]|jgi:NitT/TauT family transport system substrate-binding protein
MPTAKKTAVLLLIVFLAIACLTGCQRSPGPAAAENNGQNETICIAGQFGLVYAPLMVAKDRNLFDKYGLTVEWKEYGSGGAVREALTSGDIDVGFMGIPPFLIGWDKGVPAKVAIGFACCPVTLISYDPEITSIEDFQTDDKIALPSPGSIQHILLAMHAENSLGDPTALDDQLIALPHPDGTSAMLAKKDINAHFTTPPYSFQQLTEPDYHIVLSDREAFGSDFSFNVGLVTEQYHDAHPRGYASFVMAINEAMAWINENPYEAAELLSPHFNLDAATTLKYMTWEGMNYTTAPYGLLGFADFMQKAGYLTKVPEKLSDIAWENVLAIVGKRGGSPSDLEMLQHRSAQQ